MKGEVAQWRPFQEVQKVRRIFNFMGNQFCPDCLRKKDEDFQVVRKYIYENPDATAEAISEDTGVDIKDILEFLKEGRLQLKHADGLLVCEQCGVAIASGRLCDACKKSLNNDLLSTLPQKEEKKKMSRLELLENARSKLHVDINKKN